MITRRKAIKFVGKGFISLPLLSTFARLSKAQDTSQNNFNFITFSFPNGCIDTAWNYEAALSPLANVQDKIVVYNRIQNEVGERQGGDGHQQGGVNLFTGKKLANDNQSSGYSLDQFIASKAFPDSPISSLVQGVYRGWAGGSFRPTSWSRRSWLANGYPVTPFINPLDSFNSIFGIPEDQSDLFLKTRTSILDALLEQYKSLTGEASKLGSESKLYLSRLADQVRTVEREIQVFSQQKIIDAKTNLSPPEPASLVNGMLEYDQFDTVFKQQIDLITLAFQNNICHCASLMFGSSGEEFKHPGMKITDHMSSHFSNRDEYTDYLAYRRYHMTNLRYLIEQLNTSTDSEGAPLLNKTIIMVGSEFGDGRSHTFSSQPHLIATGDKRFPIGTTIEEKLKSHDLYEGTIAKLGIDIKGFL
ncbi:DUF1552 domain-containing protein [Pseudobacteriovorax antillogorgiicola]|uniref:DUF1552 domain-containing protein n=1 Tax=Pseudobacteriovorax antillogorgiicola TaxID=1513793 RepID=A0A1Y6CJW5_9BACT|nr:DUF1552 domain-containing protein [Pseudobacteriovorax antillogorgiicola]TCS46344.1 uncharacterized protein DUF1552 [Pseudobacteriovorax antillogorgiicola]SMF68067.1 Protein of unknown function [Pseudobacteriovorax antillogorgiicola]